jgi:alpha-mannosidase
MLTEKSMNQTLTKLKRLETTLEHLLFQKVDEVPVRFFQTAGSLHQIPEKKSLGPLPESGRWGGESQYGWFIGTFVIPSELDGKDLFLYPRIGGYEATLWVDGKIHSNFANKILVGSHGNHYCNRFVVSAQAGAKVEVALEYYAFHDMPGTQPLTQESYTDYTYPIGPVDVCLRDDELMEYLFDLRTLTTLVQALHEDSFRRADILYTLSKVHSILYYDPDKSSEADFRNALRETHPLLKEQLQKKNGPTAPYVGLTGHSHMDTAWLWPMSETVKKCARTYANQMNLMDEYPEYTFVQSSAFHSEWIRVHYPELFARIQQRVQEGRYEPNGGVWVECDCNLTGGEYLLRQFLWGQRFTQKYFNYKADTFWLPDTFGYSYAIPQIMKGCCVKYFLTTKMAWNDTNRFPYTSFLWQGMDGTRVLTHLNLTHQGPDPSTLLEITSGGPAIKNPIEEKMVSNMRLFSYGKGDGGGGPEFEMIEMSRRLGDLEGVPRSSHTSVSSFMQRLESGIREPTLYAGELYLELHRGTLTNQHTIKRNNRLLETALHDLELLTVRDAVFHAKPSNGENIEPLMNTLLVNQFHDILPGTCIHSAHAQSIAETSQAIASAREQAERLLGEPEESDAVTLFNTLSFERRDTLYLTARDGMRISGGYHQQRFTDLEGRDMLAVSGAVLPAFGSLTFRWEKGGLKEEAVPFRMEGNTLMTPFARIRFNESGAMASFVELKSNRELVAKDGLAFNTFLVAEDLPAAWDNWDIDADLADKFRDTSRLVSREVIALGPVEARIRSVYRITDNTAVTQDTVFSADSPLVAFDTVMDWQDSHRFLKTAFDTALLCDGVRNEIQFGFIRRSNHRSNTIEKARFEICNHKYSDLSEAGFGVAVLNDCKYGLSVREGSMRLSLHKGGERPDREGDKGRHVCRYAILPHEGDFSAQTVVRPAYCFNYLPLVKDGTDAMPALLSVDAPSVIIETVKPCEDTARAYILRLYESTGAYVNAALSFGHTVKGLALTNMLEEEQEVLDAGKTATLTFRPFEIKTLRVAY